jgi:fatty acid-binding protein DegV
LSSQYVIIADASTDLAPAVLATAGILVVPIQFTIGKDTFLRTDDDRYLSREAMFRRLYAGEKGGASHITVPIFLNILRPYLDEGKDILLCVSSSGLTSIFSHAFVALNQLINEYPERRMKVLDSFTGGPGYDKTLMALSSNQKNGMNLTANAAKVLTLASHLQTWMAMETTPFLESQSLIFKKGGFLPNFSGNRLYSFDDCGTIRQERRLGGGNIPSHQLLSIVTKNIVDKSQTVFITYDPLKNSSDFLVKGLKAQGIPNVEVLPCCPICALSAGKGLLSVSFAGKERTLKRPI